MLKRVVIFLYIALAVVGCSKDEPEDKLSFDSIHQTTLMYFMGTSLKSHYASNISAMKKAVAAGALGKYGSLFYLYPESSSEYVLYRVVQSGSYWEEIEMCRYEDFSTYDKGSLSIVLEDVKSMSEYTSDKVLNLIIGSHGTGWRLSTSTKSTFGEVDGFVNIWTRYLGVSSDGYLDIADMCEDMEGTHLGYILFDACLMSSVESLYRMRSYCDYVVASPTEVLTAGFPYSTVIPELFENDGYDYDLAGVCQAFYDYYSSYGYPYGTVALCVTSELEALAESVKALELRTLTSTELRSIQSYDNMSSRLFLDLGSLVKAAYVSGDYDAFEAQLARAFPEDCRLHTDSFVSTLSGAYSTMSVTDYSGVSTSHMSTNSYAAGWSDEPWAVAIGVE